MKRCTKCGEEKPKSEFYKRTATKSGITSWCKKCMDAKKTNWSNRHPESNRKKFLKRFGLTLDDYAKMLETQNGVCAVCGRPETIVDPRNETVRCLSVDHNHKTGKVRGLLCTKCNSLIGFAEDSFQTLILAAAYLRRYQ